MKDTKKRILETSLALFNSKGTSEITVRHIAQKMNISHGNLCYHFPSVDVIIEQLYYQLVGELDVVIQQGLEHLKLSKNELKWMFKETENTFRIFYKYKFFLLEFVRIGRRIQKINDHYKNLLIVRKGQFKMFFLLLRQNGFMTKEKIEGSSDMLIELLILTGDFWISEAEMLHEGSENEIISHYSKMFNYLLLPYLTPKGVKEFKNYYQLNETLLH